MLQFKGEKKENSSQSWKEESSNPQELVIQKVNERNKAVIHSETAENWRSSPGSTGSVSQNITMDSAWKWFASTRFLLLDEVLLSGEARGPADTDTDKPELMIMSYRYLPMVWWPTVDEEHKIMVYYTIFSACVR